jgi:hypothetical protein
MGTARTNARNAILKRLENYEVTGNDHNSRSDSFFAALSKYQDANDNLWALEHLADCAECIDAGDLKTAFRVLLQAKISIGKAEVRGFYASEAVSYGFTIMQNSLESKLF